MALGRACGWALGSGPGCPHPAIPLLGLAACACGWAGGNSRAMRLLAHARPRQRKPANAGPRARGPAWHCAWRPAGKPARVRACLPAKAQAANTALWAGGQPPSRRKPAQAGPTAKRLKPCLKRLCAAAYCACWCVQPHAGGVGLALARRRGKTCLPLCDCCDCAASAARQGRSRCRTLRRRHWPRRRSRHVSATPWGAGAPLPACGAARGGWPLRVGAAPARAAAGMACAAPLGMRQMAGSGRWARGKRGG